MRINLTTKDGQKTTKWFETENATFFEEDYYHNGRNWISEATGSQFHHEGLYITKTGKYVKHTFQTEIGGTPMFFEICKEEAIKWLLSQGYWKFVEENYNYILEQNEI